VPDSDGSSKLQEDSPELAGNGKNTIEGIPAGFAPLFTPVSTEGSSQDSGEASDMLEAPEFISSS